MSSTTINPDIAAAADEETKRLLARLSPEDLKRLEILDHGDRSNFVPFDLDAAAKELEERRMIHE